MSTPKTDAPSIQDVMLPLNSFPVASPNDLFKTTLDKMAEARLGCVCVIDDENKLLGVFTDGDVRRMLLTNQKPLSAIFSDDVADHMTHDPVTIAQDASLHDAVALMEMKQVWDLPVIAHKKLVGLLHLHPVVNVLLNR